VSTNTNAKELENLAAELSLRFPEQTRLIGSHREQGMDDYLAVKVEMPARASNGFLSDSPIPRAQFEPGNGGLLGPDEGKFWDPNKQPQLQTGQVQRAGARVLNIGFDDSRSDIAIVYVVSHGT
jgi:hypothetical protein